MIAGISYLQLLWFVLIGLLFAIFYFLEGFDFGVGMSTRLIAKTPQERRFLMATIGPHWDGNEVWLITAGGAMFASFSLWYASLFSGYYILLFLTLFALILRGVSFEFSAHAETDLGRNMWQWALFIGSLLAPFFLTMMFTSLIQGVTMNAHGDMSLSLGEIINPLSIVGGVAGVLLTLMHGLNFIRLKIDGEMRTRARQLNSKLFIVAYLGEIAFAVLTYISTDFFKARPVSSFVLCTLVVVFTVISHLATIKDQEGLSFLASGLTLASVVAFLFNGLFPRVLIAKDAANSLLIKDAANSPLTLKIMTIVLVILLPVVLVYFIWTYFIFKKRIKTN